MITAFLETAGVVSGLLHSPELAKRWAQPSVLAQFRVSGLAGHLVFAGVYLVERWLDRPAPAGGDVLDAAGYFLLVDDPADVDNEVARRIRQLGEQRAAGGPVALAAEFDAGRERLAALLPTLSPDRLVDQSGTQGTRVLTVEQCLLTRLVELTVHLDDLAASLGVPTPEVPAAAAEAVAGCLARIAVGRHGFLPVLRTLSRRERAAGPVAAF